MRGIVILALLLVLAGSAGAETGVATSAVFSLNTQDLTPGDGVPGVPAVHGFGPCYPNPFNPSITIEYRLHVAAQVDLAIFDLRGRLVRSLLGGQTVPAGYHETGWNGVNDRGQAVAGGVYLCRLRVDGQTFNQRMTLLK